MENQYTYLTRKQNGPICELCLNRPKKGNALNIGFIREMNDCIRAVELSEAIRIVVVRAEGDHFCAGADLNWMADAAKLDYHSNYNEGLELANLFAGIFHSKKLFIAMVHGGCFGGGVGLASACDFVIAVDSAIFSFTEVRLGLVPATIAPYVTFRIGTQKAKRLMLTGERKTAVQMEASGLIDILVCANEAETELAKLTSVLLHGGAEAQMSIKSLLHSDIVTDFSEELQVRTAEIIARSRVSEEGKEGITSFLEKREPEWK
jgi:methylglutaconyl-CoA hydratase